MKEQSDFKQFLDPEVLAWCERYQEAYKNYVDGGVLEALPFILYASAYASDLLLKAPQLLLQFNLDRDYQKPFKISHVEQVLADRMQPVASLDAALGVLRQFRHQHHLRILVNDLLEYFTTFQTMQELSVISDALIRQAAHYAHQQCLARDDLSAEAIAPLTIIAVGKLGGRELNFSSDIDLILGFPVAWSHGEITADAFYHREAQLLIRLLNQKTQEGFVYRVDLRLRPFGEEGALVLPYSGFNHYYLNHGRPWERYALIKMRFICGSEVKQLEKIIQPFVYKNYIDKSSIETLQHLKLLIEKEVLSRQLQNDIKRGLGGIRQLEFIVQLFQLIYGGEEDELQCGEWHTALKVLKKQRRVTRAQYALLESAYIFLRKLEHCLQIYSDTQTHALPKDEAAKTRLAHSMGYPGWLELSSIIENTRRKTNELFESLLRESQHIHVRVNSHSHSEHSELDFDAIRTFMESTFYGNLSSLSQQFCVDMLQALCAVVHKDDEELVDKFVRLLEAIADREAYIVLFRTHTMLLQQIISLFRQSSWCARNLNQFPSLLHELASMTPLTAPFSTDKLSDELRQMLLSVPEEDVQETSESLRKFKLKQFMRVAYSDVSGTLPLMKVSDHLTFTAESIVRFLYRMIVREFQAKYDTIDESLFESFSIIAYGKLGGVELSYQSDLDLVFLHNAGIEHERMMVRMAQRIVTLLEKPLRSGKLYDVDTRLRPSGQSGMLVNSFESFEDYLQQSAWTWEYQSLVRARFIVGTDKARKHFNSIRQHALTVSREEASLKRDVSQMRERLRQQKKSQQILESFSMVSESVKDIEFIVQYLSLANAKQYPEIIKWSDNIRILEEVARREIIPAKDALKMIDSYQILRAKLHEFSLKEKFLLDDDVLSNIEFVRSQEHKILG